MPWYATTNRRSIYWEIVSCRPTLTNRRATAVAANRRRRLNMLIAVSKTILQGARNNRVSQDRQTTCSRRREYCLKKNRRKLHILPSFTMYRAILLCVPCLHHCCSVCGLHVLPPLLLFCQSNQDNFWLSAGKFIFGSQGRASPPPSMH